MTMRVLYAEDIYIYVCVCMRVCDSELSELRSELKEKKRKDEKCTAWPKVGRLFPLAF